MLILTRHFDNKFILELKKIKYMAICLCTLFSLKNAVSKNFFDDDTIEFI